ncbi:MAG: DUF1634 domain-containing protein [Chloroflexota bacterium]
MQTSVPVPAADESEESRAIERHAMEDWISHSLRAGVVVSGVTLLVGSVLLFVMGPSNTDPHSMSQLVNGNYAMSSSLKDIASGVASGRATATMDLGLFALILTPVVRVAMTVVLFLFQTDWVFVGITAIVLIILLLGVFGSGI